MAGGASFTGGVAVKAPFLKGSTFAKIVVNL